MTTIATDGKSMVGDGLITDRNDTIVRETHSKVFRLDDRSIIGISGSSTAAAAFVIWMNARIKMLNSWFNNRPPEMGSSDEFQALQLTPDGVFHWDQQLISIRVDTVAAVGSGAHYALGAMIHGADPFEAVKIAGMFDPFTGPPHDYFYLI